MKLYRAFAGSRLIAAGPLRDVALKVKKLQDRGESDSLLIVDDVTSGIVELDLRGTLADVKQRFPIPIPEDAPPAPDKRGPGRPKLGVVGREVTLLPRHWEWLDEQPGGASVALRKLVETGRRDNEAKDQARRSQNAAYRFMSTMAGSLPGFEEALRAFYAGDLKRFDSLVKPWPKDIREHARKLAIRAFQEQAAAEAIEKELIGS